MTTRRIVILSEAKDLCPCIRNRHRRSIPGGKIDSNINTYSNERKDRAEMMQSAASELLQRIEQRGAVVGIIGLGYVGLPLAVELARAGFRVIGFDIDETRLAALN